AQRFDEPLRRDLDLLGFARDAGPQEIASARPERGARSKPDAGLVDQPERQLARVGLALDVEEQIKRALRQREPAAAGRGERPCQNVPAAPRPRDLMRQKTVPAVERRHRGALHERRYARSRILNEILDDLPERRMRLDPSDAPAGHRPVLGERVYE